VSANIDCLSGGIDNHSISNYFFLWHLNLVFKRETYFVCSIPRYMYTNQILKLCVCFLVTFQYYNVLKYDKYKPLKILWELFINIKVTSTIFFALLTCFISDNLIKILLVVYFLHWHKTCVNYHIYLTIKCVSEVIRDLWKIYRTNGNWLIIVKLVWSKPIT